MSGYVTDLKVSLNEAEESKYREQGYFKIDGDLNAGTSRNKIYLWCKNGQSDGITRIQFSFNEEMTKGLIEAGYQKIEKNLNAGAGGDVIYLWFYKGSSQYDFPITKLHVTTDVDGEAKKYKTGWERLACDLNRRAGGNWVHLFVKRVKPTYICDVTATDEFEEDDDNFQNGFIRVDEETNRDAGGNNVFIWYRLTTDAKQALKDLQISINDKEYQSFQNQHYQPVNKNLNQGTAGKPIYLWYKKDGPENPISGVSVILNPAAVEAFQKVGIQVITKSLNTGNKGTAEYLCFR